jgi:translocation and assembly module TamB
MRRPAKIALWSLVSVLLLLLLVIGAVLIGGNTDAGRAEIEKLTQQLTGGMVQLSGLAGRFPTQLTVEHLALTDDRGVWLSADHIAVSWTPAALLYKRVSVQSLHADSVSMARLPHSSSSSTSTTEPSMPRIDIDEADFNRVDLGAELAGSDTSLSLHGDARMRSVSQMQFDVTAQRLNGEGNYDVHLSFDRKRMQTVLKVKEPANGPLQNIVGLPGLGAVEAAMNFDGPRNAEKLQLSLKAGTLAGHAEGTLDLAELAADLNFEFESGAMQPRAELNWSHFATRGRWQGSLKTLNATTHVEVAGLHVPGDVYLTRLNADVSAQNGVASLRGEVTGLQIPGPQPAFLSADPVRLEATIHLEQETRPLQLSVDHKLLALRGRWQTAGKQTATLQLHLPDVTPFAALAGQRAGGSADIRGQLDYADGTAKINLTADGELKSNGQSVINMLGPRTSVQLAGTVSHDQIAVDKFKVSGGALSAGASGSFALVKREVRAKWELSVNDLATLSSALAGTLSASGSAQGSTTALAIEAQADSQLSVRGGSNGEVSAKIHLQGIPSAPAGSLSVDGALDGSPLQAEASIQRTQAGVVHTVVKQVSWRSAHLDGDVTTKLADGDSSGHASLQIGQLRDFQHLVGADMAGALTANLDLSPDGQHTRLKLQLDTQDLTVGTLAATLQLAGEGPSDAFGFKINTKLPKVAAGPVALDGAGTLDFDKRDLQLASLTANYNGQDIHLLSPAHLDFADGLAVDSLRFGAHQAQLEIQGRAFPDTALKVSLSNVGPALVNAFVPGLLAAGRIDAHAELHDSLQTPTGQLSVTALGLRFADDAALGLPAAELRADAQLMGSTADIKARLAAGAGSELTVSGRAPIAFDGALDLKIAGKLPMTLANPILEARGQHAEGSLEVSATVAGSVAQPDIGGTATLSAGSFRDYGRGLNLTAINGELVGSAATLQIKSLSATAAPGSISVTGSIGALQPKMPVDLTITAKNAQPVVSKIVTSNFDAALHVNGTLAEHLDVTGTVHLNRTLIGIPNKLPPNVAVLDVRRRGTPPRRAADKPLVVALDIKVQAPSQILVQGRGLDAEMGGELHVFGTADSPRVSGGFDLQRGSFTLSSSKLSFTSGRVGFSGEGLQNKIDPTLDFNADTSIPQGTATMHIGGYADAPQFALTSTPALPQDEIMARLMFGQSASQLSGLQLAEIGYALASLSGVGGGGDSPLTKLQKTLGLDRLGFAQGAPTNATGTDTGTSIEAGRYVSKRVYIEAKQSTTGTSQLQADIDLTKRLKLQTKLGNGTASVQGTTPDNDPGSSIGLSYQFEY